MEINAVMKILNLQLLLRIQVRFILKRDNILQLKNIFLKHLIFCNITLCLEKNMLKLHKFYAIQAWLFGIRANLQLLNNIIKRHLRLDRHYLVNYTQMLHVVSVIQASFRQVSVILKLQKIIFKNPLKFKNFYLIKIEE